MNSGFYFNQSDPKTKALLEEMDDQAFNVQEHVIDTKASYLITGVDLITYQKQNSNAVPRYALKLYNQLLGFENNHFMNQVIDRYGNDTLTQYQKNTLSGLSGGTNIYVLSSDETKAALDKGMYADRSRFQTALQQNLLGMSYSVPDRVLVRTRSLLYDEDFSGKSFGFGQAPALHSFNYGSVESLYNTHEFDEYYGGTTMSQTFMQAANAIDFNPDYMQQESIHTNNRVHELNLGEDRPALTDEVLSNELELGGSVPEQGKRKISDKGYAIASRATDDLASRILDEMSQGELSYHKNSVNAFPAKISPQRVIDAVSNRAVSQQYSELQQRWKQEQEQQRRHRHGQVKTKKNKLNTEPPLDQDLNPDEVDDQDAEKEKRKQLAYQEELARKRKRQNQLAQNLDGLDDDFSDSENEEDKRVKREINRQELVDQQNEELEDDELSDDDSDTVDVNNDSKISKAERRRAKRINQRHYQQQAQRNAQQQRAQQMAQQASQQVSQNSMDSVKQQAQDEARSHPMSDSGFIDVSDVLAKMQKQAANNHPVQDKPHPAPHNDLEL